MFKKNETGKMLDPLKVTSSTPDTKPWLTILLIIFFFPAGLYRMWKYKQFSLMARKIITVIIFILGVYGYITDVYQTPEEKAVIAQQREIIRKEQELAKQKKIEEEQKIKNEKEAYLTSSKDFIKKFPFLGNFVSLKDAPNWANGKRGFLHTATGDYLAYFKEESGKPKIVGLYITSPFRENVYRENDTSVEKFEKNVIKLYSLRKQLSIWSGANRYLNDYIKENLMNPKSFKHVETNIIHWDEDYVYYECVFESKNAFNAVLRNECLAQLDYFGNIIGIELK